MKERERFSLRAPATGAATPIAAGSPRRQAARIPAISAPEQKSFSLLHGCLQGGWRLFSGLSGSKENVMSKNFAAAFAAIIALAGFAGPVSAESAANQQRSDPKFLGIDLDNHTVYYNGRNTGNFCIYRTIPIYNPYNGYVEYRRVRRCGRGLYL